MLDTHLQNALHKQAGPVRQESGDHGRLSARGAAAALRGTLRMVALQHGHSVMTRACASLALLERWPEAAGAGPALQAILAAAEGLELVAGRENIRAALAFWGSEADPQAWVDVAA